jgi:hypothetical protein
VEHLQEGGGGLTVLRAVGAGSGRATFAVGATLRGSVAVTDHAYNDPQGIVSQFRFDFVSIEPAVQWQDVIGPRGGTFDARVSSSVLALADHPYGAVWVHDAGPSFHVASITTLRTLHGSVAYALPAWHGLRAIATYHAGGVRYDDVHPVRALVQAVTLGAAIPLVRR